LFGNPFICGTLLAGKVSSFGEGLFYRTAPTGFLVAFGQWGPFFVASSPLIPVIWKQVKTF
jgi:hypothetical protein